MSKYDFEYQKEKVNVEQAILQVTNSLKGKMNKFGIGLELHLNEMYIEVDKDSLTMVFVNLPLFKFLFFIWLVDNLLLINPKFIWIFSTKESLGPYKLGSVVGGATLLVNCAFVSHAYISSWKITIVYPWVK